MKPIVPSVLAALMTATLLGCAHHQITGTVGDVTYYDLASAQTFTGSFDYSQHTASVTLPDGTHLTGRLFAQNDYRSSGSISQGTGFSQGNQNQFESGTHVGSSGSWSKARHSEIWADLISTNGLTLEITANGDGSANTGHGQAVSNTGRTYKLIW